MASSELPLYIWQQPGWPGWHHDLSALMSPLAEVHRAEGHLQGLMAAQGVRQREQATLRVLTDDVVKTSEIEGEHLSEIAVRSSIARRLGVDIGALAPVDRRVDAVVDMVLDATGRCAQPLTPERLFGWHAALFPTGYSGLVRIRTGAWRDDAHGPMQVVPGSGRREKVHYQAPPAGHLPEETKAFLDWFNGGDAGPGALDPLIKAGLAHLWLVTLHPFDDGNGRISRAVGDMALARADGGGPRFYSLSAQIQRERKHYYNMLEATQKGTLDITAWLRWFLGCLLRAVQGARGTLDAVLQKSRFWRHWDGAGLNTRQMRVLNRLLDGFEGKLTTSKWAAITQCSTDTALRDINDLVDKGVLCRLEGGGRSTAYELATLPA